MREGARLLLDEHVGRVIERVLRDRGYDVIQAKDQFGEHTSDPELLTWCEQHDVLLLSNNAKDFEEIDQRVTHPGILLYYDQSLPDDDPEGLARAVDEIFTQYGRDELENEFVELDEWYDWLHE